MPPRRSPCAGSGFTRPSQAHQAAFERAIDVVAVDAAALLGTLVTIAKPREHEAPRAKPRSAVRFQACLARACYCAHCAHRASAAIYRHAGIVGVTLICRWQQVHIAYARKNMVKLATLRWNDRQGGLYRLNYANERYAAQENV